MWKLPHPSRKSFALQRCCLFNSMQAPGPRRIHLTEFSKIPAALCSAVGCCLREGDSWGCCWVGSFVVTLPQPCVCVCVCVCVSTC